MQHSTQAMARSNTVDINQLTEKLVDLKLESRKHSDVSANEENIKENKVRPTIEGDGNKLLKTGAKTASKCKSVPRAQRRPLSNLTNTMSANNGNNQTHYNEYNPAKMQMADFTAAAPHYYNNNMNNTAYPWYIPPNYAPQEQFASFPFQNNYYDMAQSSVAPVANHPVIAAKSFTTQAVESSASSDNESVASTNGSLCKASVQKIQLTQNNLSNAAWVRYSEQMIMAHDPAVVWDAPYAVTNVTFQTPFDLILKVWHQPTGDKKKYFKIYLVHKHQATEAKNSAAVLRKVVQERENTVDIDIQVQDVCAGAMKHVIVYMYTGHVTVTAKDLIPLYTLVERLKMKGDIQKQLWINIRNQYTANPDVLIPYLVQSDSVEAYAIKKDVYAAIVKRAEKKQLEHVALHKLSLNQFADLFKEAIILSNHKAIAYDLVIRYIHHFIQKDSDRHYARSALQFMLKLKQFNGDKCSVSQCIEFLKIMDNLYREEADSISLYAICATKVHFEFNPFNHDDCNALHHLQPQTFNSLLVNSLHCQKSMIEVAILKYKELNADKYHNQLKAFNFTTIWKQRTQIYGKEATEHSKTLASKKIVSTATTPASHKPSPSLTPLSGTNDTLSDASDHYLSPPLLHTPPSPPKSHNACFSPVAPRYRVPPKLIKHVSECSLLQQESPNTNACFYTPDILDAAIASIEQENINLAIDDEDEMNVDERIKSKYLKHTDVSRFASSEYASPEGNIENGARATLSFKRKEDDDAVLNPRKSHIISPDFTPEKLVFRSRPITPRDTYKAPKINKGCLVETIDKYHSGVAKLYSPPKWRNDKPLDVMEASTKIGNILESRVVTKRVVTQQQPQPVVGFSEGFKAHVNASPPQRNVFKSGSLSPSRKRGSGGAYCVECNEWRHKFDFTKSQWRNRPRGFRRCKHCTGEIGSDSKQSPQDWSPRRYRMKANAFHRK